MSKSSSLHQHDPKAFEERAVEAMRENGFRITMPRLQVIRVLSKANKALSAYDIHEAIREEEGVINVVSVYRVLATLAELELVHHVGVVNGYLACQMDDEHTKQMEHVVCSQCGSVQEVEVPTPALESTRAQMESLGFAPSNIKIEIVGLCATCRP